MSALPPATEPLPPRRADARFLWSSPWHLLALGFGSGLSPRAPGTVGTLWAWLAWLLIARWTDPVQQGLLIALALPLSVLASTRAAQGLGTPDPSAVVVDEIVAFWIVLWLWMPVGFLAQLLAFALFRYFDAAKPGPVAWADRCFKCERGAAIGWHQGAGIVLDDLVAALCTLLVLALLQALF